MTEEEARNALFQLHFQYMMHPPKERLKLYEEYHKKRGEIRSELSRLINERKENAIKSK